MYQHPDRVRIGAPGAGAAPTLQRPTRPVYSRKRGQDRRSRRAPRGPRRGSSRGPDDRLHERLLRPPPSRPRAIASRCAPPRRPSGRRIEQRCLGTPTRQRLRPTHPRRTTTEPRCWPPSRWWTTFRSSTRTLRSSSFARPSRTCSPRAATGARARSSEPTSCAPVAGVSSAYLIITGLSTTEILRRIRGT